MFHKSCIINNELWQSLLCLSHSFPPLSFLKANDLIKHGISECKVNSILSHQYVKKSCSNLKEAFFFLQTSTKWSITGNIHEHTRKHKHTVLCVEPPGIAPLCHSQSTDCTQAHKHKKTETPIRSFSTHKPFMSYHQRNNKANQFCRCWKHYPICRYFSPARAKLRL